MPPALPGQIPRTELQSDGEGDALEGAAPPLACLAPPDLQVMSPPTSYVERMGTKFGELIRNGTFGIIKGRYFEDCIQNGEPFQCRQKIPPEYIWEPQEALENWELFGPLFLVVISYAWLAASHPDPDSWHLRRLAKVTKLYRRHVSDEKNREGMRTCLKCSDVGIILDFCSLWQAEVVDKVDQRTEQQVAQFKEALREINTPYGHEAVAAWVLKSVPASVLRKYDDRGWTLFEKNIIDSKGSWSGLLRTVLEIGDSFDEEKFDDNIDTEPLFNADCAVIPDEAFRGNLRRGPPLTPDRFNAALLERSEKAAAKGVLLFTNGKEDKPLVIKKYKDSFSELGKTNSLDYSNSKWGLEEMQTLVEAMPYFEGLEVLSLNWNQFGTAGAKMLADVLPQCPKLRKLHIPGTGIGPVGQLRLLQAWLRVNPGACSCQSCCDYTHGARFFCCNCVENCCACSISCCCCGNGFDLLSKNAHDGSDAQLEVAGQFCCRFI